MKQFEKLTSYPPRLKERYNSFIVTEFDDSMTVEMQFRVLIKWIEDNINLTNDMVDYLNEFIETFDAKLYETVSDILTIWLNDGQLKDLINNEIFTEYIEQIKDVEKLLEQYQIEVNSKLNLKVDKGGVEQVSWGMLAQNVKENITGGNTAVVGVDSVSTLNIVDKSVTNEKLSDNYTYSGLQIQPDLNMLTRHGSHLCSYGDGSQSKNFPVKADGILEVTGNNGSSSVGQMIQTFTTLYPPYYKYTRAVNLSLNDYRDWVQGVADKSINRAKLSDVFSFNANIENGNLNDCTKEGLYLLIGSNTNEPNNIGGSAFLDVKRAGIWVQQEFRSLQAPMKMARRTGRPDSNIWLDWEFLTSGGLTGESETWLINGDSNVGNNSGATGVTASIADISGANCINGGFGGCRMAKHSEFWNEFSFYRICEEFVKDDSDPTKWEKQKAAIENPLWTSKPSYFDKHLNNIINIKPNNLNKWFEYYGTNDWSSGVVNIDNPNDIYDVTTYKGAFRYGSKIVSEKYPHIEFILITPNYRYWLKDNQFEMDSDTNVINGVKLTDFVTATKEVAKETHFPCIDIYNNLGVNKHNRLGYFSEPDTTHMNSRGTIRIGSLIGKTTISTI